MACFLAKFYLAPVKKAYGKKNPESQNAAGLPDSIHPKTNLSLSFKSVTQDDNGFRERKPTLPNAAGT